MIKDTILRNRVEQCLRTINPYVNELEHAEAVLAGAIEPKPWSKPAVKRPDGLILDAKSLKKVQAREKRTVEKTEYLRNLVTKKVHLASMMPVEIADGTDRTLHGQREALKMVADRLEELGMKGEAAHMRRWIETMPKDRACYPDWMRELRRIKTFLDGDCVVPSRDLPNTPPIEQLFGFGDILKAINWKNTNTNRSRLKRLNAQYPGPIVFGSKGKRPQVESSKLLSWHNGLSDKYESENATNESVIERPKAGIVYDGKNRVGHVKKSNRSTGHLARHEKKGH